MGLLPKMRSRYARTRTNKRVIQNLDFIDWSVRK